MDQFQFDEGTSFDAHKGSGPAPEPKPKNKGGRPKTVVPPEQPPEIGNDRLPTPVDLPAPLKGRRGPARTGKWPVRKPKGNLKHRPHGWALQNKWQPIFLEAYERCGIVTPAADKAGISVGTVANERKRNPEFDAAFLEAHTRYVDAVKAEVAFRAIEGNEKFVWDKKNNERVSLGNAPNDILLMFYMKYLCPEFRDNWKTEEDRSAQQATQNLITAFLMQGFNPQSNEQATAPELEVFARAMPALPPPDETPEQEIARLKARLAELETPRPAPESTTPDAEY